MIEMQSMHLKDFLYDLETAKKRVSENGGLYGFSEINDIFLLESDFEIAKNVYDAESEIVHNDDYELTDRGIFNGIVYFLLTPLQNFTGQTKGFEAIMDENQEISPEYLDSKKLLIESLKESGVMFYEQKANYIFELNQRWDELNILMRISEGLNNNREQEIMLRKDIISDVKGLGEKTTSLLLRMCGAEFLVPVDSWMAEMLSFHGYLCEMPRTKVDRIRWGTDNIISTKQRKKGLNGKKYIKAEAFALDLAGKYDVSGYLLQLAFWAKKSTYNLDR